MRRSDFFFPVRYKCLKFIDQRKTSLLQVANVHEIPTFPNFFCKGYAFE